MENGAQAAKVKMSGYLHLKKKKMMSTWKNYWFVLEDRLLLFYHSKAEYEAISPCKGSINLGPPCAVKSLPSVTNGFQIETRTLTYSLKADNAEEQKKWLQILLAALNQNQNFTTEGIKRLSHFRYSLDNLVPEVEPNDSQVLQKLPLERQHTLPDRVRKPSKECIEIIERLQKMGAQSYGGSLEAIKKRKTKKLEGQASLENDATVPQRSKASLPEEATKEEYLMRQKVFGDNIYERISGDSLDSNRGSFLVDNENYSVLVRKSALGVEKDKSENNAAKPTRETKSLMVENDQYGISRHVQSDEVIYSEPKTDRVTDCNKNSVIVENSFYASADVDTRQTQENVYEDLDKFNEYCRPVFRKDENSSQSSAEVAKSDKGKPLKKSKSFMGRAWKRKNKKKDKEMKRDDDDLYAEIDTTPVDKVLVNDENALQMLSELQNILENKKSQMKGVASKNPNEQSEPEKIRKPSTSSDSEPICPSLPPKIHKSKQPIEQVRSLDEILEDLDKEQVECKSKVQMLIEKFSEPDGDVILRKHDNSDLKDYRHSDDLNKLLNELTKVTSAPIMTPGVTSSLVNPNLTDEEWLKLLPVRQRRLSEPDYDVPRLHSFIQLPAQSGPDNSDAIQATRFFGPVLPSNITDNIDESMPISMTPDSLEVEEEPKMETHVSYSSHDYNNQINLNCFAQDLNQQDDKIIYAMPKSYFSVATHIVNTCQNICGAPITEECTIVYKTVKNVDVQDEIFNDSLELCHETATEF